MSEKDIAAAVSLNQSTVNWIHRRKQEPSYTIGLALVALAEKLPPETAAAA